MKKLIYIATASLFAFVMSIQIAQAQTHAANNDASDRSQPKAAEFQLENLLAQNRKLRRAGFSLMPAGNFAGSTGSAFTVTPMAAAGPNQTVFGSGTVGRLTRWAEFSSGQSIVTDSIIFESPDGLIGIGTDSPTSKLTVMGLIESKGAGGGIKFPDGTIQTTAAISSIFHDASLTGNGTSVSPLGIAAGGVNTFHLANGSVSGPKIANGTVVRSLNGMFDNVSIAAGSNISVTPGAGTLTIAATGLLSTVNHGVTLTGNGTAASPLNVANSGISNLQLANNSVTASKIASGQVVKSLNGLFDSVSLAAGSNITITPVGNTLTIASTASLSSVAHNATLTGNGTAASPLGVKVPLELNSTNGPALFANALAPSIVATSTGIGASGIISSGGPGGNGVVGVGGFRSGATGGVGTQGQGGNSDTATGGAGLAGSGGDSESGNGGPGVAAFGGDSESTIGGTGIVAIAGNLFNGGTPGRAGVFNGAVSVIGTFNVTGTKNFQIDHPLDPENKYLYHAAIESSEVLNIYSGNINLDRNGEATVKLPEWFEALNKDIRYSLTAIGMPGQGLYIAEEVSNNQFRIAGGMPGAKVSWQVTGIRSDAAMRLQPFKVEEDKPEQERGFYLTPEAHNQPQERHIEWVRNPELMLKVKQRPVAERRQKQQ